MDQTTGTELGVGRGWSFGLSTGEGFVRREIRTDGEGW